MTTNSNCPSMSALKKRFNEIISKSFSETNLDKREWLNKHEQQRGGNTEVVQPGRKLSHRHHVTLLLT